MKIMNIINVNDYTRVCFKDNIFFPQFVKFKIFNFKFWSYYYTQQPEYKNDWHNGKFPLGFYSKDYAISFCKRKEKYSLFKETSLYIKQLKKSIKKHLLKHDLIYYTYSFIILVVFSYWLFLW